MTKDELIERLARAEFERVAKRYGHVVMWGEAAPSVQESFRDRFRAAWPLIVRFVALWLAEAATTFIDAEDVERLIRWWREEMIDPAPPAPGEGDG